jgi:hypothetical protein
MPKKKSPKQLDAEIAEALTRPRAHQVNFPALRVTTIYEERVDEWYGVSVRFKWSRPFNIDAYRQATRAEEDTWFKTNKVHAGLFPLEKAMGDHIRREVTRSPQWIEFFSKPRSIPRFTERDIDNWDFDEQGGTASANTRDE